MIAIIVIITVALILTLLFSGKKNLPKETDHVGRAEISAIPPEEEPDYFDKNPCEGGSYVFKINQAFPDGFTAIDFETATASKMACQLGIVQVDNGQIVLEREFLIQPPGNKYDSMNVLVHGISPEVTASVPSFGELWPDILPLLDGRLIVAHNAPFDRSVLEENLKYYGLPTPDILGFGCTCGPFGNVSLYSAAKHFGINLAQHHDALADARACALLAQEYGRHIGETVCIPKLKEPQSRSISKENKGWSDRMDEILDNPFKGKTVVITGTFDSYPSRDELAEILKGLGARVTSSVSRKTSIVLVGAGAGPSKMERVEELRAEGIDIDILNERDLLQKLKQSDRDKIGTKNAGNGTSNPQ